MKAWQGIIALVGLAAVGGGGYYANEAIACHGLEEDYLNSFASIRGLDATMLAVPKMKGELKRLQDAEIQSAALVLAEIDRRCGERAAKTANRKAMEQVFAGT